MLLNFVQINCASCSGSAGKGSDSESFQLAVLIIWLGQNNVGCNKHFDPRSPGSDLNPVIRTDCMCFVRKVY